MYEEGRRRTQCAEQSKKRGHAAIVCVDSYDENRRNSVRRKKFGLVSNTFLFFFPIAQSNPEVNYCKDFDRFHESVRAIHSSDA